MWAMLVSGIFSFFRSYVGLMIVSGRVSRVEVRPTSQVLVLSSLAQG